MLRDWCGSAWLGCFWHPTRVPFQTRALQWVRADVVCDGDGRLVARLLGYQCKTSKKSIQQKSSKNKCTHPSTGEMTSCGCRSTKSKLRKMMFRRQRVLSRAASLPNLGSIGTPAGKENSRERGSVVLPRHQTPMRPVLEERCSSNARGNPLQTHMLQECQPLWCRKPLGRPHCFSCSGGDRADACEFAKQAMAARKSNALWSAGNSTARLLLGVHKRRRCRVRGSSQTCSSGAAHTE